jgi:tRNA pseudouridine55 synthase
VSKPSRFYRDISGILLLDKALGVSSNAALQQVRALFGAAKAGHAGSLDPLASGLLPVCFGQATKVCGRLLNSGKTYRVLVQLGARTESGDGETEVVERAAVPPLDDRAVDAVLASFLGEQAQIPPMHSALKFEGKRLYELARRGESVEREPRRIFIHRIARVRIAGDQLEFDVYCSKGTYIRTLAADIADRLGTLGYVVGLRRLSLDPFADLPMYTIEQLAERSMAARDEVLLQPDRAFLDLPRVELATGAVEGLLQGRTVSALQPAVPGELRAYDGQGRFLGMVQGAPDGRVRPVRLFVDVVAGP